MLYSIVLNSAWTAMSSGGQLGKNRKLSHTEIDLIYCICRPICLTFSLRQINIKF